MQYPHTPYLTFPFAFTLTGPKPSLNVALSLKRSMVLMIGTDSETSRRSRNDANSSTGVMAAIMRIVFA